MRDLHIAAAPSNTAIDRKPGSLAVQISNAAVQVYRAQTGRGPTRSRAFLDHCLVVVELQETLTTGERNLVAAGHSDTVTEMRHAYRRLLHQPLVDAVERLIDRPVLALLSDCNLEPDIAVEVFVLAPES